MPLLQKELSIFQNDLADLPELVAPETARVRQRHRLQPKLRIPSRMSHMDVRCLTSFLAEKEETITPDSE
jgi:hypothetical protein